MGDKTEGTDKINGNNSAGSITIRVATYNIHAGIGKDNRRDMSRIAEVIVSIGCRVVALQEVLVTPDHTTDCLGFLEQKTGLAAIAGVTVRSENSRFGNVLLTDLPVTTVKKPDLSVSGHEQRGALDVRLLAGRRQMRVLATHLGLNPYERRLQVKWILDILRQTSHPAEVTVMLGDINEWFLWGRPLRWIHRYFGHSRTIRTFPARMPLLALDRIWCHPAKRVASMAVCRTELALIASDHLPLVADIRV